MPDLSFAVDGAEVERYAAAPFLRFRIAISCADPDVRLSNVMLQCQLRIDTVQRGYRPGEKARLVDLFGQPEHWSRSVKSLLWTHASTVVPAFERSCVAALPVPCSFDFNVAATKYFAGLDEGDIPLLLLFSGAVFYDRGEGLQIDQIAWDREVRYRLPLEVWRSMMAHYYPDSAWLQVPRGTFDRLNEYRQQHGLTGWEQALERLLDAQREAA